MVLNDEPQATKSFLIQQFFKNAGEVWASSPHLRSKSKICNMVFLLQSHFLKLSNSSKVEEWEISCKFRQGNGAIAARWQAKAGVEPPFAGCERPFSLRTFHLNSKISPCNPSLKIHFSRNAAFAKIRKNRKIAFAIKKLCEFLDNRPRNLVQ